MLFSILLTTILLYILRYHYEYIRGYILSLKIDGPRAYPIIGNGLMFYNKSPSGIYLTLGDLVRQYGVFFRIWLGTELNLIIHDPNDVEIILSNMKYMEKSPQYDFLRPWLNDGLLLSSGKKWHNRRKVITPAFHFKILERFVEIFDRLGNTVIEKLYHLDDESRNNGYEFNHMAALYALDVMCETAMGVSLDALSKPNSEYVKAVNVIAHVTHIRMFDFLLRYPLFYNFSKLQRDEAAALRVLHGFTDNVIRKRRQELSDVKLDNDGPADDNDDGVRKKRAFLDILLHSMIDGKPLNDLEIREEVDTFMFEGHDTTTAGITFALYNLAKHPNVQQKCYNEICDVFDAANKNQSSILHVLNELSYLELAIKESLRLFPSVPIISRLALEDVELTKNRIIPRGACMTIPISAVNKSPQYFDDPEDFIPERFLDVQTMEKRNAFAYIPFSAGPRNCVGQKFAMYEMKCIVSKILHNFEVSLTKESECDPTLVAALILRAENPIKFYFKKRI